MAVRATAEKEEGVGALGTAAIAGGLIANPVVLWSLYTLKTTGNPICRKPFAVAEFIHPQDNG